jgi:hypothetical protein
MSTAPLGGGGSDGSERSDDMAYVALRDVQRMASHYAQDLTADLESWKVDHDVAMRCRDLEEGLAVFNGLLGLFLDLKSRCDSEPIPSELDFDGKGETRERHIVQAFSLISDACRVLEPAIRDFESQGYDVVGSRDLLCHRDKIQQFLQEAKRIAKIEGTMGFRGVKMAPNDAETFRALLDAHSNSPNAAPPVTFSP